MSRDLLLIYLAGLVALAPHASSVAVHQPFRTLITALAWPLHLPLMAIHFILTRTRPA